MKTYADRLAWAMECFGLSPASDQTTLAKMVGKPCKPQNIQHLLDPNKNAKSSKYTPRIAVVLECDSSWLAYGTGDAPVPKQAKQIVGAGLTAVRRSSVDGTYPDSSDDQQRVKTTVEASVRQFIDTLMDATAAGRVSEKLVNALNGVLEAASTNPEKRSDTAASFAKRSKAAIRAAARSEGDKQHEPRVRRAGKHP